MKLTPKQQAYRKILLKQIHLSPRYVNFYKENRKEYEEMLSKHFGVVSAANLSINNLQELNNYLCLKKPTLDAQKEAQGYASSLQCKTIRVLWGSYATNKTDEAFLNWLGKRKKGYYMRIDLLPKSLASKMIAVLKTMQKELK